MHRNPDIYGEPERLGRPSPQPSAWRRAELRDCGFFRLQDLPATEKHLKKKFTANELQEAGIIQTRGAQRLATALHSQYLLAVRRAVDQPPLQLLAGTELLPGPHPLFLPLLMDYRLQALLRPDVTDVIVVSSPGDLALLWGMQFPAILAAGLESVAGQQLTMLQSLLGYFVLSATETDDGGPATDPLTNPADLLSSSTVQGSDEAEDRPQGSQATIVDAARTPRMLVLCNWSLLELRLTSSTSMRAVEQHLLRLEQDLDVVFSSGTWEPAADRLQALETAVRFGTLEMLEESMQNSIACDGRCLGASEEGTDCEPSRDVTALIERFNATPVHLPDRLDLRKKLHAAVQEFSAPLLRPGPNAAAVRTAAVATYGFCSKAVNAEMLRLLTTRRPAGSGAEKELRALQGLVKEHTTLGRSLMRDFHQAHVPTDPQLDTP